MESWDTSMRPSFLSAFISPTRIVYFSVDTKNSAKLSQQRSLIVECLCGINRMEVARLLILLHWMWHLSSGAGRHLSCTGINIGHHLYFLSLFRLLAA